MDVEFDPELYFIAVDGNIGSGKSTFLQIIEEESKKGSGLFVIHGWRFRVVYCYEPVEQWKKELALFKNKTAPINGFFIQTSILNHRVSALQSAIQDARDLSSLHQIPVIVLMDRSFLGDNIFAAITLANKQMTEFEYERYKTIADNFQTLLNAVPSHYIYINVPAEKCMERITQRARPEEDTLSLEYLLQLQAQHDEVFDPEIKSSISHYINDHPSVEESRQHAMNHFGEVATGVLHAVYCSE